MNSIVVANKRNLLVGNLLKLYVLCSLNFGVLMCSDLHEFLKSNSPFSIFNNKQKALVMFSKWICYVYPSLKIFRFNEFYY